MEAREVAESARNQLGKNWRRRAEAALDTLADAEGLLAELTRNYPVGQVCNALREIIDAGDR